MSSRGAGPGSKRGPLLALLAAIALAALLGGCFGGGGDKRAVGTLEETLSYVPADAGLVAIVPTDLDHGPLHDLDVLASRFDRWDEVKKQLEARIGNGGLSFDRVLQPQLGSVLAVAVVGEQRQVSAIRLQDPGALRRVVQHELTVGEATKLPDHAGAFMWRERGGRVLSFNAIAAGHLISGSTARDVTQAIDAHGGDNAGSDAATVAALKRLGEDSLVRVVGDAQRLLDAGDPAEAAELRKLRWIGALGRFQGTAHVVGNDLTAAIRLDSDRRRLTDRDLPLAPGTRAPLLHEIGTALALGLLEPDRLVRLLEPVLKVTSPDDYADYQNALGTLRTGYGIDLHRDLLARIRSLSISVASATALSFKAELTRGAGRAVRRVLARAEPFIADTVKDLGVARSIQPEGAGARRAWVLRRGPISVGRYTVRGDTLVGALGLAAMPGPGRGQRLPGAEGSLALHAQVGLVTGILNPGKLPFNLPTTEVIGILSQLGDLSLNVRTETAGVVARARVQVGTGGQ